VGASPRRAHALARRDPLTSLGTSARRAVSPLIMRIARLSSRSRTLTELIDFVR
jgi:hypothetical protein